MLPNLPPRLWRARTIGGWLALATGFAPGRRSRWLPDVPAGLRAVDLGPSPDPLGRPGLAARAMRRHAVRSLRELLLSQREIDDLRGPDLDARVIRLLSRRARTACGAGSTNDPDDLLRVWPLAAYDVATEKARLAAT
ncbi:1-acylglycerol-3-phosphate O-acyltransferase [Leifsonia xyli subsp. cynodontis DSM 46306]|uniref:Uncharacterized protein n=1 Tax=Leifsonia xyli subsp. cynodontis DSM 46306 TaxID=1389489 RepID=U3P4V6_LEIXC|nr:hypothetical protein [Leifsonia xyli]AGW40474.1 1-acylglycerol-3-phosphate O-acyltransferase [Leifsonia xyli subsp. cynodontis DSM 46306]